MSDRRLMRFVLPEETLLRVFQCWRNPKEQVISVPQIRGLPDDAKIRRVNYSYDTLALEVVVESSDFAPVPLGMAIPFVAQESVQFVELKSLMEDA